MVGRSRARLGGQRPAAGAVGLLVTRRDDEVWAPTPVQHGCRRGGEAFLGHRRPVDRPWQPIVNLLCDGRVDGPLTGVAQSLREAFTSLGGWALWPAGGWR